MPVYRRSTSGALAAITPAHMKTARVRGDEARGTAHSAIAAPTKAWVMLSTTRCCYRVPYFPGVDPRYASSDASSWTVIVSARPGGMIDPSRTPRDLI